MATFNAVSPRVACLLRGDFLLEPFTRGLASEAADEHAQRFGAGSARRTLPCCASKPLVAFASRTDHNAAPPFLSLMCAPELSTREVAQPAAITQLPDVRRSRRRGQARQP